MDAVIDHLLTVGGPLGLFVVVVGYVAWQRDVQLRACQEQRIQDNERLVLAITESTACYREHTEVMREILREVRR
jgi:hypothetical protein